MSEQNQQFDTFDQWVNKASSWLTRHPLYCQGVHALCYDTKGRLCTCGGDMMRARDEKAFPIKWIWPDQIEDVTYRVGDEELYLSRPRRSVKKRAARNKRPRS
jgi:hypothetical protein